MRDRKPAARVCARLAQVRQQDQRFDLGQIERFEGGRVVYSHHENVKFDRRAQLGEERGAVHVADAQTVARQQPSNTLCHQRVALE